MKCFNCASETSNPKFCSRSCSVSYSNRVNPKRGLGPRSRVIGLLCMCCGTGLKKDQKKFCSTSCQMKKRSDDALTSWLNGASISVFAARGKGPYRQFILDEQNGKCAICGISQTWNGLFLQFIMDHIDGNSENNSRSNLRLICPNCEMQLPTSKGKTNGSGRKTRYLKRQAELAECGRMF